MIFRYLYILLFLFIFCELTAQSNYSHQELMDFVYIYMSHKKDKKRDDSVDSTLFSTYAVSRQRYQEITKKALTHEKLKLSPNEVNLMEAIHQKNKELNLDREVLLEKLCAAYGMKKSRFIEIQQQYQNDIRFQRSLKPLFTAYLNRLK